MKTKNNSNSVIAKQIEKIYCDNLLKVKTIVLLTLLSFLNCSENPEKFIEHIEGYWEIEEAMLNDGTKKQYKFNETIDYIKINDSLKGFRKKLKPGINNTYYTSDDAETLVLKIENDSLNIYYSTPFNKRKETILEASSSHLRISNENKDVYLYKRYTPIQLDID